MTNLTDNAKRTLKERQAAYDRPMGTLQRQATKRPGSLNPHKGGAPKGKRTPAVIKRDSRDSVNA